MKEYRPNTESIIRIRFGIKAPVYSISFTDTTVKEVAEIATKIFKNVRVNINLENVCPLESPVSLVKSTVLSIREERASKFIKGSISMTLYGISSKNAFNIFSASWRLSEYNKNSLS